MIFGIQYAASSLHPLILRRVKSPGSHNVRTTTIHSTPEWEEKRRKFENWDFERKGAVKEVGKVVKPRMEAPELKIEKSQKERKKCREILFLFGLRRLSSRLERKKKKERRILSPVTGNKEEIYNVSSRQTNINKERRIFLRKNFNAGTKEQPTYK